MRISSNRSRWSETLLAAALSLVLLGGCGGSSGGLEGGPRSAGDTGSASNGADAGTTGNTGDTGNTGNTGNTGGTITGAQRAALLADTGSKFQELRTQLAADEANRQMADYLSTLPEIEAAGVSEDGCAWGRFTDGRLAIFVNNREPVSAPAPRAGREAERALDLSTNIPSGDGSYVADILGTRYGDYYSIFTPWFQAAHYAATLPGDLIVMTSSVQDCPLLVISTHGGSGVWRDGTRAYALWGTAFDNVSDDGDGDYAVDLDARRLCYMYADTGNTKAEDLQWRYAFTARYVMDYLSFAKESFVFMDACSSDEPVMRAAFLAKGASVYTGWSAPVSSEMAGFAAARLFDRLLGGNRQNPESPKQRPFDWESVYKWLQENGYDIGQPAGGVYLKMTQNPASQSPFGEFAPSLALAWAHPYEEKLYLYGLFGDDPGAEGEVTVDGTPLTVQEWTFDAQANMDRIVCQLPYEGAGSAGDVKVTVRKHESNVRQLSRYRGFFKLTHEVGDGRQFVVDHYLRFRVDLQSLRTAPGETPKFTPMNPQRVDADTESYADFEASGAILAGDGSLEWVGKDTLLNNIDGSENPRGFIASMRFDPANQKARLELSGSIAEAPTQLIKDASGAVVSSFTYPVTVYGLDEFDGKDPSSTVSYVEIDLGADFSIPKGSATATKVWTLYGGMDTVKIEWDAIPCEFPPKADDAR